MSVVLAMNGFCTDKPNSATYHNFSKNLGQGIFVAGKHRRRDPGRDPNPKSPQEGGIIKSDVGKNIKRGR